MIEKVTDCISRYVIWIVDVFCIIEINLCDKKYDVKKKAENLWLYLHRK